MQLHSPAYLAFLCATWIACALLREGWRWFGLLLASLIFYAAPGEPRLFVYLGLSAAGTWLCGIWLGRSTRRVAVLWTGVGINLVTLLASRALPRLGSLTSQGPDTGPAFGVVAVGVSFYTFQALGYLIDVYRGHTQPEPHLGRFCLYLSFFPKLLQGPIERAQALLPQLQRVRRPDYDDLQDGAWLILWGYVKKLVIADRLAGFVDPVYGNVHDYQGPALLAATLLFAFQIYADFSGYTDIALGSARCFGLRLSPNFDRPYAASSVSEFWRRWHMSLASWLRDYVFLPVTSWVSRRVAADRVLMMRSDLFIYGCGSLVTMLLCGLWHGASWTFAAWGFFHGLWLFSSMATRRLRKSACRLLGIPRQSPAWKGAQRLMTFALVCAGWVFFRASTLDDAWYVLTKIPSDSLSIRALGSFGVGSEANLRRVAELLVALLATATLASVPSLVKLWSLHARPNWVRWCAFGTLLMLTTLFATDGRSSFLYARY